MRSAWPAVAHEVCPGGFDNRTRRTDSIKALWEREEEMRREGGSEEERKLLTILLLGKIWRSDCCGDALSERLREPSSRVWVGRGRPSTVIQSTQGPAVRRLWWLRLLTTIITSHPTRHPDKHENRGLSSVQARQSCGGWGQPFQGPFRIGRAVVEEATEANM